MKKNNNIIKVTVIINFNKFLILKEILPLGFKTFIQGDKFLGANGSLYSLEFIYTLLNRHMPLNKIFNKESIN